MRCRRRFAGIRNRIPHPYRPQTSLAVVRVGDKPAIPGSHTATERWERPRILRILSPVPRLPRVGLACLAAVVLFSACGGEADPATDTSPATTSPPTTSTTLPPPTTTVPPTTTTLPPPTTTVPPTTVPEASEEVAEIDIGPGKVWGDVFEMLVGAEQSCVRDAVGGDLDRVLRQEILDEDEVNQQELALLPCLPPQVIRAVFLAGMMLGMEDDGVVVSKEQEACLREVVDEMDVSALVALLASDAGASDDAAQAEDAAQLLEMMAGLLRCLPDLFHAGVDEPDDYDGFDDYADGVEGASSVVLGEVVEGVLDYQGDVDFFGFEAVEGEVYEIGVDLGTLSDSVVALYAVDGMELAYNDDREDSETSLASRLVWRAPASGEFYVEVSSFDGYGTGSYILTVAVSTSSAPEASDGIGEVDVDYDTVWGDVFDTLTVSEQSCIRDAVGAELDWMLRQEILGEDGMRQQGLASLRCLPPQLVRAVFLASIIVIDVDEEQEDCLQEVVDGVDVDVLLSEMASESTVSDADQSSVQFFEMMGDLLGCLPEVFDAGVEGADDYADGVEGAFGVVLGEAVEGVVDHEGDVDFFVFEAVEDELYEIDVTLGTLADSSVAVHDADGALFGFNDEPGDGSLGDLLWKAPTSGDFYVKVSGYGEGSYMLTVGVSDVVDDFANWIEGAAGVVLGEAVEGVIDYEGDVDVFVFDAVEGELYEIDVTLGTLAGSRVAAYAGEVELGFSDDRGDGLGGSRLLLKAPASGDFYVGVWSTGEGSYTLTVAVSDVVDDYADSVAGAAGVVLGETVEGGVDYEDDVDYFVFGAVEGEWYEVDVALGSLADSAVWVLDAEGRELAYNVDGGDPPLSRLVLRARATGDLYVGVSGYDSEGSYTLTVGVSDVVDDYANLAADAARVGVGETIRGVLDYVGDVDVFVFEAVERELYEIDVALGTLSDSFVSVYDAGGRGLAYNVDGGGSLVSRLVFRAPATGEFYVGVSGYDSEGSYTLGVEVSDVVDDHSNWREEATVVAVGESLQGVLDYVGDVDVFVFEAVEGELYEVEADGGTLPGSWVQVCDEDWSCFATAHRVVWMASSTGKFYIEVSSEWEEEGSYTLTVAVSE